MKSVLIIGLGHFGRHLCEKMYELDNEIMIVDKDESKMTELLPMAVAAQVGDCTQREVIKSLGVGNFDLCFVCIGSDFQSSLEITNQIKEAGAKYVVSLAARDIQVKFLLKNGADDAVYPSRDSAERIGKKYSAEHVFDYFELTQGYSIYETQPKKDWIGKMIAELDVRDKHRVSIFGIRREGELQFVPKSSTVLLASDHILLAGKDEDITKILKSL